MSQLLSRLSASWKLIAAVLSGLLLLYGGAVALRKTGCWVIEVYDRKVADLLMNRRYLYGPNMGPLSEPKIELPYEVFEIAASLSRKQSSVRHSLRRLRREGKVEQFRNGWRWAKSPHQPY